MLALDTDGDIVRRYAAATLTETAEFGTLDQAPNEASFGVNFGDLDVGCDGNIYIVGSSSEPILELTGSGAFVAFHDITNQTSETVQNKSALDFDRGTGRLWVGLNDTDVVQGMDGLDPGTC